MPVKASLSAVAPCLDYATLYLPLECFCESVLIAINLENLDRLVTRAGCESPTVVVQDCVVLRSLVQRRLR